MAAGHVPDRSAAKLGRRLHSAQATTKTAGHHVGLDKRYRPGALARLHGQEQKAVAPRCRLLGLRIISTPVDVVAGLVAW